MTDETPNRYDEVKDSLMQKKKLEEIVSKTEHPASEVHDEADESLKKEIYDFYSQTGNLPRDVATPDDIKGDILSTGIKDYQRFYVTDSGSIFKANVEDVISNIPQSDLETLASQNVILGSSEGDDREVLSRYNAFKSYEDLKDRYENDKGIRKEEQELLNKFAERGAEEYVEKKRQEAIRKEKDRQSNRGYQSKRLQELAANSAELAVKISLSNKNYAARLQKEFVLTGITKQIEDSKREYEDIISSKHDYLTAVKNTLRNLGSSDDPNKFGIGLYALEDPKGLDSKYLKQR